MTWSPGQGGSIAKASRSLSGAHAAQAMPSARLSCAAWAILSHTRYQSLGMWLMTLGRGLLSTWNSSTLMRSTTEAGKCLKSAAFTLDRYNLSSNGAGIPPASFLKNNWSNGENDRNECGKIGALCRTLTHQNERQASFSANVQAAGHETQGLDIKSTPPSPAHFSPFFHQ